MKKRILTIISTIFVLIGTQLSAYGETYTAQIYAPPFYYYQQRAAYIARNTTPDKYVDAITPLRESGTVETDSDKEYWVNVDFTDMSSVSFVLVRKGSGGLNLSICDDNKTVLKTISLSALTTSSNNPKGIDWFTISKPSNDTNARYYLKLSGTSTSRNDYRLNICNNSDLDDNITDIDNAVEINHYYRSYSNTYTSFAPTAENKIYLRLVNLEHEVTVTLLSNNSNGLRFQILDRYGNPQYDSSDIIKNPTAKRTNTSTFTGNSSCEKEYFSAEKVKEWGLFYYVVIFNTGGFSGKTSTTPYNFTLTVGNAQIKSETKNIYATSEISATKADYSSTVSIDCQNVPKTSYLKSIVLTSNTSGYSYSKMSVVETKKQNTTEKVSEWKAFTKNTSSWSINEAYFQPWTGTGYLSTSAVKLSGIWDFRFKSTTTGNNIISTSPLVIEPVVYSFIPGFSVTYDYEVGD
jgi:hypothetical protein